MLNTHTAGLYSSYQRVLKNSSNKKRKREYISQKKIFFLFLYSSKNVLFSKYTVKSDKYLKKYRKLIALKMVS